MQQMGYPAGPAADPNEHGQKFDRFVSTVWSERTKFDDLGPISVELLEML
jgi:hypothetical protein